MFYSQFILAKKGPLGTIWIAAHLERKLRKNQVADTDIGLSVDSILFPEVPIALRLSSHLLLGVVRIYSRKVNYLFHDCSEAVLKVKQAFRSTAVDLPPEESTAPYHSITLPETFHLDDFELPDSAFQGDFIDHHVSTKEQITLQDTMDGAGFSSMQFGLDERFGDGNASQIGFDLDGDIFLDKHLLSQHVSLSPSPHECAVDGNDTGFLNVDDEEDCEEAAGNDMQDIQDAQSLENSGWSTRTRGVARYLKTLFDKESGLGRKVVLMDQLIAGKTRKEASRMFFETLILKTKDYIHVEQKNPCDFIAIKPRVKLLESEF